MWSSCQSPVSLSRVLKLTLRPCSPTLTALHFDETPRDFSHFYDLDRFYHESRIPAVELSSLKYWNFTSPPPLEPMSCWSILELTAGGRNVNDGALALLQLNVAELTNVPNRRLDGRTVSRFKTSSFRRRTHTISRTVISTSTTFPYRIWDELQRAGGFGTSRSTM